MDVKSFMAFEAEVEAVGGVFEGVNGDALDENADRVGAGRLDAAGGGTDSFWGAENENGVVFVDDPNPANPANFGAPGTSS